MKLSHILLLAITLTFASCTNKDTQESDKDSKTFGFEQNYQKLNIEQQEELNSIMDKLEKEKKEALKFLYAHMTLADIIDYQPAFYKEIVDYSFQTKETFQWNVPETEFYHFVLPHRVNNENLDSARRFMYHQLKERLEGMSMLEAALEVNHWCHEHVAYRAADERTSSPMASYKNGYARCGEESTFTVTALRSVGIPARQVYTPRWAHTDDNHAWVEFWADGKWYYYGACEPEAVENLGWFTEPARRAMLVNTRVVGKYKGSERILKEEDHFAILNTLNVYADTKEVFVMVNDEKGNPVENATVEYLLYNYAEFYPIASKETNTEGLSSFITGLGDILVWASKEGAYGFTKVSIPSSDTVVIEMSMSPKEDTYIVYDIHPPVAQKPLDIPQGKQEENKKRLAYEDSIRAAYEMTFMNVEQTALLAENNSLPSSELWPLIQKARANWDELEKFLNQAPTDKKHLALELLKAVNEKDLRDAKAEILLDHLNFTENYTPNTYLDEKDYYAYILRPRVRFEMLLTYREVLNKAFEGEGTDTDKKAQQIKAWMDENTVQDNSNFYRVPISPIGVYKSGRADEFSQKVFFIAACRSIGIAARNEPGTMKAQYLNPNKEWITVDFDTEKSESKQSKKGSIQFTSESTGLKYFKDFTLSKMENGKFSTLQYDWDKVLETFEESIPVEVGYYRLTTGHRLPDGSVLSSFQFYTVKADNHLTIEVNPRHNPLATTVLAQLPADLLSSCTTAPYQVLIWMDPNTEPAKHIVQDISALKEKFEAQEMPIQIFLKDQALEKELDPSYFGELPQQVIYSEDKEWTKLGSIEKSLNIADARNLPLVVLLKGKDIIFISQGYRIGVGDEIIKISK